MPRMKARRSNAEPKGPKPTPVLDALDLPIDTEVRFRYTEGADWLYGRVNGDNKDGSVSVGEKKTGHFRAFMPEKIERKVIGPRGGIKWEPLL